MAALMIAGTVAVAVLAFLTGKTGGEIVHRHGERCGVLDAIRGDPAGLRP